MVSNLTVKVGADIAGLQKELNKATKGLDGFGKNLNRIGGLIVGALSVRAVANFSAELIKLAGEADGVRRAFEQLPNSAKLMQELKTATSGTVSELELMKRAVQASNFDISLKELPKLLEFAAVRAQQTGESVDHLVNSIVTGIGRKSPLILDNLGISSIELKKRLGDVSIAAADVGTVTRVVGEIASESLQKSGSLAETTTVGINRLAASWENLKVVIGDAAEGGGWLSDFLTNLSAGLDSITEWLSGPDRKNLEEALAFFGEAKAKAWAEKDMKAWMLANNAYQEAFMQLKKLDEAAKGVGETVEKKVTPPIDKQTRSLAEAIAEWDKLHSIWKTKPFDPTAQIKKVDGGDFLLDLGVFADQAQRYAAIGDRIAKTNNAIAVSQENLVPHNDWAQVWIDGADIATSAIAQMAASLGAASVGVGNFGDDILKMIGSFAMQLGEAFIAAGTAVLVAKTQLLAAPGLDRGCA